MNIAIPTPPAMAKGIRTSSTIAATIQKSTVGFQRPFWTAGAYGLFVIFPPGMFVMVMQMV
ncbi:hypothetical protein [Arthrobacter sp. HS15c]|uniref:hypothetical protein n=1 Tax=Arthrobacter sp. HS15c TaxID=3230279 RepID=UPI003467C033